MAERIVELKRCPTVGFGFSVIGGSDTHIPPMICALVRQSPALFSQQVWVGDVVLKVNGLCVAQMPTKEVVALIRNCRDSITLTLVEDRLMKLKARPFLQEDSLIEPPVRTPRSKSPNPTSKLNVQRIVGSPRNYECGTDGRFLSRSSLVQPSLGSDTGLSIVTAHIFDLGNEPKSPTSSFSVQDFADFGRLEFSLGSESSEGPLMKSSVQMLRPSVEDVTAIETSAHTNHSLRESLVNVPATPGINETNVSEHCNAWYGNSHMSITKNACPQSPCFCDAKVFVTSSSSGLPIANPESSGLRPKMDPLMDGCLSSYSSPDVYAETSENQKNVGLTPNISSFKLLSLPDQAQTFYCDDSTNYVCNESNATDVSGANGMSLVSDAGNRNPPVQDVNSPADIASRLFALDGFTDKDVAPMLGKPLDFNQRICQEYLRFFTFAGLSLDEALRMFLKKFPLTGETQERERILVHFSRRFRECNDLNGMSEDAVHTLTCALMLLNTDLHGQNISTKMTVADFVSNLSGLCDGGDFSKEMLKTLYQSVKSKEIVFGSSEISPADKRVSPRSRRMISAQGNPFVELKVDTDAVVMCEGMLYRKCVMDADGRRTAAIRRNWKPFFCVLKGLVLLLNRPHAADSGEAQAIGIHHALAGFAKDYKKKPYIFKLITADWQVFYLQAKNQEEVRYWMDGINVSAALLSAAPLPAPVGSSRRFQRPVLPVSMTKKNLNEQVKDHIERVKILETDLKSHCEFAPPENSLKDQQDWETKLDYLEFELKRFKAYVTVLTSTRLSSVRQRLNPCPDYLVSTQLSSPSASRSSSHTSHDVHASMPFTPRMQRRIEDKRRESYLRSIDH